MNKRYFYRCYWFFFFFKQKTAYDITASDWSSDVCSSDLTEARAKVEGEMRARRESEERARREEEERPPRSEERRVGNECSLLCRSRWSHHHQKNKAARDRGPRKPQTHRKLRRRQK